MAGVGFVGLGIMGGPMAHNLSRRFPVTGFDVDEARFLGLDKVERAPSLIDLAAQCDVICLSLPSAPIVEDVLGPKGLGDRIRRGSLVIDFSTGSPSVSRRLAAALAERGVEFADAPVSGGEGGAKSARLAIMVGATESTYRRCLPYLECLGKAVRVGDVGAGGVAKLVNNMIVGVEFAIVAEGFALAERNGVDVSTLFEAIRSGWAGSKVLDVAAPAMAKGEYIPGGTVNMLRKDLGYARELAADSHVPVPMTALAHEVYVAGQAAGRGRESQPVLMELWRRLFSSGDGARAAGT